MFQKNLNTWATISEFYVKFTVHSSDVPDSDNTERCWTSLGTSVCLLLKDLSKDEFAEFFMDH